MHRTVLAVVLLLTGFPALAPQPAGAAEVAYALRYDDAARALAVRICLAEAAPERRFFAGEGDAVAALRDSRRDSDRALTRDGRALVARDWQAGECLHYTLDMTQIARAQRNGSAWQPGDDLLFSARAVLWRPRGLARSPEATVAVSLPAGFGLSVPWQPLDAAPHRRFRLGATSPGWPTLIAIGRFAEHEIAVGSGRVRLAVTGVTQRDRADTLADYVATSARNVAATFPQLFDRAPQVAIIAVGPQREAVPFGQSFRGGGTGIVLFVDPGRTRRQYLEAWTLHHELVHLAHPYLDLDGRWISEGIATYFQNVVRARAGWHTPHDSWEEIEAGFARGRADDSRRTLEDTSVEMNEGRHYMRAYWSGTALMLLADVELRQRAQPASLELALNRYLACCLARAASQDVREFLAGLDRQVGGDTFTRLYAEHAEARGFPDVGAAYDALGISADDGRLRYGNEPKAVALRRAIMGGD